MIDRKARGAQGRSWKGCGEKEENRSCEFGERAENGMRGHGGARRKLGAALLLQLGPAFSATGDSSFDRACERGRHVTDSRTKTAAKGLKRRRGQLGDCRKAAELRRGGVDLRILKWGAASEDLETGVES